jgi:hypothetical protein
LSNDERCPAASGHYHAARHVRAYVGEATEYKKTADSGAVRPQGFCQRCGTALYSTSVGDDPKAYNVRVGIVRQRDELVPRRQLFVRSQQAWVYDINSIPKFEKMPPR